MAELSVELTAKIDSLIKQLDKAEKKLAEFGDVADEANDKLGEGSKESKKDVESLTDSLTKTTIAGVGLATIAVAIFSELVKLGNQGNRLSDGLAKLTGTTDKLALAKRRLGEESKKEVSNVRAELVVLNSLLNIGRDETKSKEDRQIAINKINKEYDKLLPNITQENIGTKATIQAVTKLSEALIRQAQIRGAQNLIAKETEKILELEQKTALDAANAWDFLIALRSQDPNATLNFRGLKRQNEEISEAEERIRKYTSALEALLSKEKDPFKPDGVKKYLTLSENVPSPDVLSRIFGLTDEGAEALGRKAEKIGFNVANKLNKGWDFIKPEFLETRLTSLELALEDFNQNIEYLAQDGLTDALTGFGSSIGTALAEGGNVIQAIGSSILQSFGNFLSGFGQQLVQYGVAALAFATVSKGLTNPLTAGPSAIAAIAIGTALSVAGAALSSFGSGGLGSSSVAGQGGSAGSTGGNSSTFTSGTSGYGEVVFRISGQELVGVLSRVQSKNVRFGANG